jgi:glycerol-3-phosphate acyltransferase PlsY
MTDALLILAAYLLGSISSAIIVCRIMGLPDPRTQGSNNPGATNVLRIGGKKAAAITLFGDSLKGVLPVVACHLLDRSGNCLRTHRRRIVSSVISTRCSSASRAARA